MVPLGLYHPATLKQLAAWSTLSRNEIGPFLDRFGIVPLGRKFPMIRIYAGVLGVTAGDESAVAMLGQGLIRAGAVAELFGMSDESFLGQLRTKNDFPPLYTFGPRRNLMLRGQIEQMLCSPRNAWHPIPRIEGHALPPSRLAAALRAPQGRVDALLADRVDPPMHIRSNGRPRYILADMQHRLRLAAFAAETGTPSSDDDTASGQPAGAPGGLFADAAAAVQAARAADSCTGSGKAARGGDFPHGNPAEAKLSGT